MNDLAAAIKTAGLWIEGRADTDGVSITVKNLRLLLDAAKRSPSPDVSATAASGAAQPVPSGASDGAGEGWQFNLEAMPVEGHFEALQRYPEVFRHGLNRKFVVCPSSGRMFVPVAWRPARDGETS